MPKLTKELIKFICDDINSPERLEKRKYHADLFCFYQGKTKEIIKKAIQKEFKKPETLDELMGRLLPLNILRKIINKSAGVYVEPPIRNTVDGNETDEELLSEYTKCAGFNSVQKEADRYSELFKCNLQEWYVDDDGYPMARNLPRHTYEVYAIDTINTSEPNVFVKILTFDNELSKQRFSICTDDEEVTVNGRGELLPNPENPNNINPYGKAPYIYLNESTYGVNPIDDDDSLGVAITIPILLTDLLFACKYQCFSIFFAVGITGDIPLNPNSVVQADFGKDGTAPTLDTIKPTVDSDKIISLVESILAIHLSNKNLSVGTVSVKLSADNISGVSKALDSAENMEDRRDKQDIFQKVERKTWNLIAKHLHPYWRQQKDLAEPFNKEFSEAFQVTLQLKEPQVMPSERENIELSKMRLDTGVSTLNAELKKLYPYMTEEEVNAFEQEIISEREANVQRSFVSEQPGENDGEAV